MTWVKLDDQFADHPKLRDAGPLAGWLYISALCYASRYLTDGLIKDSVIPGLIELGVVFPRETRKRLDERRGELIQALLDAGLWEATREGFWIHDFHHYNPSAEDVKGRRQRDTERHSVRRNPSGVPAESQDNPRGTPAESQDNPRGIRVPRTPAPSPAPGDPSNIHIPYKDKPIENGQEDANGIPGRDIEEDYPNPRQAEVDAAAGERARNRARRRPGGVPEV